MQISRDTIELLIELGDPEFIHTFNKLQYTLPPCNDIDWGFNTWNDDKEEIFISRNQDCTCDRCQLYNRSPSGV